MMPAKITIKKEKLDRSTESAESTEHIKQEQQTDDQSDADVKPDIKSEPSDSKSKPAIKPVPDVADEPDAECSERIVSLKTLEPWLARQDNWKNYDYITDIPDVCKSEPCMMGIDEAGRGPVLGPMVYGIAFCPLNAAQHLKTLGCADSKQLTERDRDQIFDAMNVQSYARDSLGWAIDVISPNYISAKMLSRTKVSLNEISMLSAIGLVRKALDAGVRLAELYVDTVGPPDKYQARLSALFPGVQVTVAKKADSTYPIVSAASIAAKVSRDHALRVWRFHEGIQCTHEQFGSGYPGDPKTKAFLEENVDRVFGFPRIVRFSWSTAENVLKRKAIGMAFPDTEDELEQKQKKLRSIKNFLKPADANAYEPCQYFRDRFVSHCFEI